MSSLSLHSKSIRRTAQVLIALTAASFFGMASAQMHAGPHDGKHGKPNMERMAERRIDHMIAQVNGTPEQKAKLTQLAQAAQKDMQPLHEQMMAARSKGMALLAAPQIDRAALEKLRAEQAQLMDNISKRMLAHMADAAEVFTPAQRAKLAEKMKAQGERGGRGGMHGGMHGSGGPGMWMH